MSQSLYQIYANRTPSKGYHFHLLAKGSSNPKMAKLADQLGIIPFAPSLAPFTASGAGNVCPFASPGCSAVCLNYAGRGKMSVVQRARIQKTRFWFSDREGFLKLLTVDLEKVERLAEKRHRHSAVRLNVFSDIPWERFVGLDRFPRVQFYDYTKIPKRLGKTPKNYYLTFSLSETNESDASSALEDGFNVAAPFREKPKTYLGHKVIDGDTHDYRFLDERPRVVALKPKGLAKEDTTGFVREECAIYARVSTTDQSIEPQLLDLRQYARQRGWKIFREYGDTGISGTKDSRPALNELMNDARKRRFDVVLVWRFDRFARSTKHLVLALEEFRNLGIDFVSYQENIDTSSPLGAAIFTIISAVAQLERDIIAERVKAGLRRAKERGKRLGRPRVAVDVEKADQLRTRGFSLREVARLLHVSKSTLYDALRLKDGNGRNGPSRPGL